MSYIVYWYQPSETAYELYSHMGKQIYWGSYTIAELITYCMPLYLFYTTHYNEQYNI